MAVNITTYVDITSFVGTAGGHSAPPPTPTPTPTPAPTPAPTPSPVPFYVTEEGDNYVTESGSAFYVTES